MTAQTRQKKEAQAPRSAPRYFEAVGRRKTAVARVRIKKGSGNFVINDKDIQVYFPTLRFKETALAPLKRLNVLERFDVSVKVRGGGISAQAGAVRHGISRALSVAEPEYRPRLRTEGFLTRDPRMVERKKYGLRKSRRAQQWSKR